MTDVVERFALMERCRECLTVLPLPPAPRVCDKCGSVKVTPRHTEWSHELKVWLLLRFAERHLFVDFRTMQDSWELLLIGNYERTLTNGRIIPCGVAPDEVFPLAVKDAAEWKAAGAKTAFL
jgi:hypothetical protein